MDLSEIFYNSMVNYPRYKELKELVDLNSTGNYWIIGGFVYRNLVKELYGVPFEVKDIDVIIEKSNRELVLPSGWIQGVNRFGNPKIKNGDLIVDFVPIKDLLYIKSKNLPSTIESYLLGIPLSPQAVAFDIDSRKLIGDVGIKAILDKRVEVYNHEMAIYYSNYKKKSIDELITKLADELRFKAVTI